MSTYFEARSRCRLICLLMLANAANASQAQQVWSLAGKVKQVGGLPVPHVEVRLEDAGSAFAGDHGEFTLEVPPKLKPGFPVTFSVNKWVVISPCVLKSGRTYLPAPGAEQIPLVVLPRGDRRLKTLAIGCLLEEATAVFPSRDDSAGTASYQHHFGDPGAVLLSENNLKVVTSKDNYFLRVDWIQPNHITLAQDAPLPNAPRTAFLSEKANSLGLSLEELQLSIETWAKTVKDPYEQGLAAFYEGRYRDAGFLLAESLRASGGSPVTHYVPLARTAYQLGDYSGAKTALEYVLAAHPDDVLVQHNLAIVVEAMGQNIATSSPQSVPRTAPKTDFAREGAPRASLSFGDQFTRKKITLTRKLNPPIDAEGKTVGVLLTGIDKDEIRSELEGLLTHSDSNVFYGDSNPDIRIDCHVTRDLSLANASLVVTFRIIEPNSGKLLAAGTARPTEQLLEDSTNMIGAMSHKTLREGATSDQEVKEVATQIASYVVKTTDTIDVPLAVG